MPSSKKKPVVFLFGPTASGKTELAINLVDKFPIKLISVDSVMVYKGCDIGSAKPSKEVLKKYPHHLIDVLSPNEIFTVGDFCRFSKNIIQDIHNKNFYKILTSFMIMFLTSKTRLKIKDIVCLLYTSDAADE